MRLRSAIDLTSRASPMRRLAGRCSSDALPRGRGDIDGGLNTGLPLVKTSGQQRASACTSSTHISTLVGGVCQEGCQASASKARRKVKCAPRRSRLEPWRDGLQLANGSGCGQDHDWAHTHHLALWTWSCRDSPLTPPASPRVRDGFSCRADARCLLQC